MAHSATLVEEFGWGRGARTLAPGVPSSSSVQRTVAMVWPPLVAPKIDGVVRCKVSSTWYRFRPEWLGGPTPWRCQIQAEPSACLQRGRQLRRKGQQRRSGLWRRQLGLRQTRASWGGRRDERKNRRVTQEAGQRNEAKETVVSELRLAPAQAHQGY